jgi:hypothetical protein
MIPDYVRQYWAARAWEFLYFGIPALCGAGLAYAASAWSQYQDDIHVNDDDGQPFKNAGKTLGL